ncbi:unnamed protein product [Umbelopsis vinacea]
MELEHEKFVRHLAAQLTNDNLTPVSNNSFEQQLARESARVLIYEDRELLDLALEYLPLGQLYEDAETDLEKYADWGLEDVVIIKLLEWFKSFFSWVDQPACQFCLSKTTAVGRSKPSFDDIRNGASVVELYKCQQCNRSTHFPRYNNPAKLLHTRRGRCGEWANCFTLCCRAVGVEARYVLDTTDHVWTEIYSQTQQRWVHCDPCENAFDRPLLYSAGWGKALSYCIAFSAEEAMDVTKRYTTNWPVVLSRRRAISEPHLLLALYNLTQKRYRALSPNRVEELQSRRAVEQEELERSSQRVTARDDEMGSASIHTAGCGSAIDNAKECIQLTAALPSQAGSAFLHNKIMLDKHDGVAIDFAFKIANEHDGKADGADGMAFVVQSCAENVLGEDRCEDPSGNHISIHGRLPPHSNSAHHKYSHGHTSSIPAMNSGTWFYARIHLLVKQNAIIVSLSDEGDEQIGTGIKLEPVLTIKNINISEYLGRDAEAWIGFTASTGGLVQSHQVKLGSVSFLKRN